MSASIISTTTIAFMAKEKRTDTYYVLERLTAARGLTPANCVVHVVRQNGSTRYELDNYIAIKSEPGTICFTALPKGTAFYAFENRNGVACVVYMGKRSVKLVPCDVDDFSFDMTDDGLVVTPA